MLNGGPNAADGAFQPPWEHLREASHGTLREALEDSSSASHWGEPYVSMIDSPCRRRCIQRLKQSGLWQYRSPSQREIVWATFSFTESELWPEWVSISGRRPALVAMDVPRELVRIFRSLPSTLLSNYGERSPVNEAIERQ